MVETHPLAKAEFAQPVDSRVRRLEEAVAALQDTHLMEDRVADRVVQRLKRLAGRENGSVVVESSTAIVPTAEATKSQSQSSFAPPDPDRPTWLLFDLWAEVRTFGKMLFDHRYPFSYSGRFGPICIAFVYVFCWFFVSGMPIIGGVVERIIDIILAVLLYKIMSREVRRYRTMFPA
jgi:hypothetical protein